MFNQLLEEILTSKGIEDYDQLNPPEKETYLQMIRVAEKSQITVESMKQYIRKMRIEVELELVKTPTHEADKDIHLRARLLNYILFEAFLETPERARQVLEQYK